MNAHLDPDRVTIVRGPARKSGTITGCTYQWLYVLVDGDDGPTRAFSRTTGLERGAKYSTGPMWKLSDRDLDRFVAGARDAQA